MPIPNLARIDTPLGPLRDYYVVDISSEDYEQKKGFICQVATAGNLTIRTLHGVVDLTIAAMAIGDSVQVAGIPVILKAVRTSSTVTSIIVGRV